MLEIYEILRKIKLIFERKISISSVFLVLFVAWSIRIYSSIEDFNKPLGEIIKSNKHQILNNTIIFLLLAVIFVLIWLAIRRIPKFKQIEIGVLFAIRTDNENVREKIKKDFFTEIERNIKGVDNKINVLILSEYHSEKIDNNKMLIKKYHETSNAKFILYGIARNRIQNGKEHYVIEFNESVSHKRITEENHRNLVRDMFSVFPRKSMISHDEELTGFSLNSLLFTYGSLYILGLACIYNGYVETAYKLHKKCNNMNVEVKDEAVNNNFIRIKNNNKQLIMNELHHMALKEYAGECNWSKIGEKVKEAEKICSLSYDMCALSSIYYFHERDIKKAKERLFEARKKSNGDFTWAYSLAFLFAYEEKLNKSYTYYKIGFQNRAAINVHIQCEEFIYNVLELEPDKYQLHYCLGLLYYYKHEDYQLANEEFKIFLSEDEKPKKYEEYYRYLDQYIV